MNEIALMFLHWSVLVSLVTVSISILLLLYRTIKGPTNPDRAIGLDAMGITLIALAALVAIQLNTTFFNEVILLIGILAFIGTVAIAKFIEKGVIIDHDRDKS
ncbi:multicomponent Na+:H+ antiporter subunit F [Bacillus mesophilus]|uniref:Na(+)/H(+) antiporter subunit F1 n=1 Tax=Bacillus mesophilus TaxID=1808955 RepID=A0A6M0Q5Z2_9BACI|nr:Na(+)/H(+) antiporter subunit F1 [Bacillus mesophilus]MBM7660750.1 multicomponent Na+:H+ antiporter subunit F [Bacillus mesophilus]NEY71703.1 Na(+)/H(+) antiporter subunit F1 [Bacillus mesophilus]